MFWLQPDLTLIDSPPTEPRMSADAVRERMSSPKKAPTRLINQEGEEGWNLGRVIWMSYRILGRLRFSIEITAGFLKIHLPLPLASTMHPRLVCTSLWCEFEFTGCLLLTVLPSNTNHFVI